MQNEIFGANKKRSAIFEKLKEEGALFISEGNIFDKENSGRSIKLSRKASEGQIVELGFSPEIDHHPHMKLWAARRSICSDDMAKLLMSEKDFFPECEVETFLKEVELDGKRWVEEHIVIWSDNPGYFIGFQGERATNLKRAILCVKGDKPMIQSNNRSSRKSTELRKIFIKELGDVRTNAGETRIDPTVREEGYLELAFVDLDKESSLFFDKSEESLVLDIISENASLLSNMSAYSEKFFQV